MNVYQKLAKARVTLQELGIKKSGKNGNRFNYFELKDFLPEINNINNDIGLLTQFTLVDEKAILCITNCEKPEEQICFESPVAHAKLQGGASPIQELGSQHTYMRRYMLLMAYEIVEDDTVDAQEQSDNSKQSKKQSAPKAEVVEEKPELVTSSDIAQLTIMSVQKGISTEKLLAMATKQGYKSYEIMTKQYFNSMYKWLTNQPDAVQQETGDMFGGQHG